MMSETDFLGRVIAAMIVIYISAMLIISGIARMAKNNINKINQQTANYECFYNGQPVNRSQVDIFQYRFTIDDDSQKIYLTDKPKKSSTTVVPLPVPAL